MDDFSVPKKCESALGFFDQLERATAPAQTTHLQNIRDVKKIGCMGRRVLSALDRRQQIVALDWFREDFGVCNFKSLFGRGIIWKKQNLKRRKNFAERRTEREPIDPLGFELGQEKITLGRRRGQFRPAKIAPDSFKLWRLVLFNNF